MRLYAVLEDVGTEYITIAPVKISTKPFKKHCYYIDIDNDKVFTTVEDEGGEDSDWKIYNGVTGFHVFYNPKTKEYIKAEEDDILDDYDNYSEEGTMCQEYKNGVPVGEPYFEKC